MAEVLPPEGPDNGRWEMKKLNARHQRMIELTLLGKSKGQIAEELDTTPQSVYMASMSPLFQAELVRRREQQNRVSDAGTAQQRATATQVLSEAAVGAATELVTIARTGSEKARLTAVRDILDRTGYGRSSESLLGGATVLKGERLELLIIALRESREMKPVVSKEVPSDPQL